MKENTQFFGNTNPIRIGIFTILAVIGFGAGLAFVTGFATPSSASAQVIGPCCTVPPPPPPPIVQPPPPPPSVPTPIATCKLTASKTKLSGAGTTTLSWKTTNATKASIDQNVGAVTPVASGSKEVALTSTKTYTMTVSDPGTPGTCSVTVTVVPPPPKPTCTLTADPASVNQGAVSKLLWKTTNATSFTIDHNIGSVTPVASGATTTPALSSDTTYTGTATGTGGTVTCKTIVTVVPPPPPKPTCTLSADPSQVNPDSTATLSWTSTHAVSLSIDHNIGSVTPVTSGATTTPVLSSDTIYTATATASDGKTAICKASVTVGSGGSSPACTLSVSPTSVSEGGNATLSWGGTAIKTVFIDNGIGTTTSTTGSTHVSPSVGTHTYTGTFTATNGQDLTCKATLTVTSGGGGGGCASGCGGGGAPPPPTIMLAALPHIDTQPLAYLYLSQIPYTGLDLGPIGTAVYWTVLTLVCLIAAYFILFGVIPFTHMARRNFVRRVARVVPVRRESVAPVGASEPILAVASTPVAPIITDDGTREQPRGYSTFDGFRSFAKKGILSVEDIVQGLSREHASAAAEVEKPIEAEPAAAQPTQPSPKPVQDVSVVSTTAAPAVPADVRGLAMALVEKDRAAVFAGLRQHIRGGGAPEALVSAVACLLDDAYRARIDGTACDSMIAERTAAFDTPTLEHLVGALATAIDASYSDGVTGAKMAFTRALAVLGA